MAGARRGGFALRAVGTEGFGGPFRKSFDGVRALADVSLEFPSSGIIAVIGPNGAGKTTLINVLTGFLRADSGRSFLGERKLTGLAPHKIARLGIGRTFQDLRLINLVSVLENVMLARPNQKGERLLPALFRFGAAVEEKRNHEEAMRLLRFVELADKANELAGELSYGQQKLLTLACCLATKARILLLDEPVAGVHPEMVEKILGLLSELRGHPSEAFFSIVVFTGEAELKSEFGPAVLRLNELVPYLSCNRPVIFDERKMADIVGRIEMKRKRRSLETDEYHLDSVRRRIERR
jgi:ABC-type branched-subunit amino acid transport system ATPase component